MTNFGLVYRFEYDFNCHYNIIAEGHLIPGFNQTITASGKIISLQKIDFFVEKIICALKLPFLDENIIYPLKK